MAEAFRVILLVALAAALLTTLALAFAWWMEPPRRMRRALLKALAAPPEVEAMSVGEGKACALNFDMEQVVVLWASGGHGLAYAFEEVDGGEIMAAGTPAELIREHASREVLEARFGADRNEAAARTVQAHAGDGVVHRVEVLPDRVLVYARRADDLHDVVQRLVDEGALPAPATTLTRRASLEDVFLILTGRTLVD